MRPILPGQVRPRVARQATQPISDQRLDPLKVHDWHEKEVPADERAVPGKKVRQPIGRADIDLERLSTLPPKRPSDEDQRGNAGIAWFGAAVLKVGPLEVDHLCTHVAEPYWSRRRATHSIRQLRPNVAHYRRRSR